MAVVTQQLLMVAGVVNGVEFADLKELFDHNDFVHGVAPEVEETKADGEEVDEISFFVEFADLKELFDHNDFVHGVAPEVEETKADGEEVDEINFFVHSLHELFK
ncbi:hypothetical protein Tco_1506803 [Tanacetum coccineum]